MKTQYLQCLSPSFTSTAANATTPAANTTSTPTNATTAAANATTPAANTTPTSAQPATTAAPSADSKISLGFRLQQNFTSELANQSSQEFKDLAAKVTTAVSITQNCGQGFDTCNTQ